jgi:glycine oxidase
VDVAVVGGGVIGAACARAAAARGLVARVFEPGLAPGAASPASAGMLAAQIEPADAAQLARSVRARDLYGAIAPALEDSTGIAIGLWRDGIANLAFDDVAATRLRDDVDRQRRAGLRAVWLDADEVRRRWPGANAECRGALFAPDDGAIDPEALTRALLADARRLGATVVPSRVAGVRTARGRAEAVITAAETVAARHVVLAAGAWSPLVAGVPRPLPVRPVRGQLAVTSWPAGTPPAILYYGHAYVLARGREAVLGSTMEEAGFAADVTDDGQARIRQSAITLLPAIADLPIRRAWAGLRPVTPDGLPIVGREPDVEGLWYATGHGRNGILLAALTGEVMGDLLAEGSTGVDISSWRVDRFLGQ